MNNENVAALYQHLQGLGERGGQGEQGAQGGSAQARQDNTEGVVWFVEHGSVDIFLVPTSDGLPHGAREHLVSVSSGQLFAFPAFDGETGYRFVASPAPDTRYRLIPWQDVARLLEQDEWGEAATVLLDRLMISLSGLLVENRPEGASSLNAGAGFSSRQAYDSGGGTAVLRELSGSLRHIFDAVIARTHDNEADELNRLQRKTDIGRQSMTDALGGLVALFDERDGGRLSDIGGDRLLGACNLIGKRIGVTFRAAPGGFAGGKGRDLVKQLAAASGVRTRFVALKGQWWRKDNGPLLVFTEKDKEAFALLSLGDGSYEAIDPVSGKKTKVTEAFANELAQFGYMFYRSLPSKIIKLSDIFAFSLRGLASEITSVALIGLASVVLAMAIPIASGHLFDDVFPAADYGQMTQVVIVLFIVGITTLLFDATRSLLLLRIEGKASSDLQAAVWDRVLNLPMSFFRDYAAGDLATRINGINEIRQALSGTVISSILGGLFSVLNIVLLLYYSPKFAAIALGLVFIAITFNLVIAFFSVKVTREAAKLNGKVTGLVLEYLNGITKLKVTGSESRAFANWAADFAVQMRLTMRAGTLSNVSSVFGVVFPVLANASIFACIALGMVDKESTQLSTGEFIAFSATFTLFLNSMLSLLRTGMTLLNIAPTYERTKPILEALPEVDENKVHPGQLNGAIELSHVSFAYSPDTPQILDDISLSVKAGEFVALVGASGSGKSTLLRLMLGFEKPGQGGIYYDEHNLADIDVGALRRQLGVVLQGGRLMSGDIFTNIIGSSSLLLADAWAAARACGLDKDIEAMPMGMNTLLSDGAGTLSGGQRQRLLIARAIVNKPRVIFFDEATSALDNQTQAVVSASLAQLRATRVVIAHRLSTIIHADRIFVLDKGKLVQSGTYEELLGQDGLFAELAKRQIA